VPTDSEASFRALLDERGLLRQGALAAPDRSLAYAVFAQRTDARLDIDAVKRQAERFFSARVGLTVDKRYDDRAPAVDAARVVLAGSDGTSSGTRLCFARPVDGSDLGAAEEAERATGTYGLALLATRCKVLWCVLPAGDDDRAALTLAAILASTMLGPILGPGGREIFGVRGARLKLEGHKGPYR
jgi:hypothetical protein